MDLPKILLTGLVFLFFFWFSSSFGQLGLGHQKTSRNTKKTKKNQSWMDLPKILLTGLFFFVFFWFSSSFWTVGAWDTKKPRENEGNPKKQKKQSGIDLLQILLTGLFFCFFLVFLDFLDICKGGNEKREKTWKDKRCKNPTLPASLSVFFCSEKFTESTKWVDAATTKRTYHRVIWDMGTRRKEQRSCSILPCQVVGGSQESFEAFTLIQWLHIQYSCIEKWATILQQGETLLG